MAREHTFKMRMNDDEMELIDSIIEARARTRQVLMSVNRSSTFRETRADMVRIGLMRLYAQSQRDLKAALAEQAQELED